MNALSPERTTMMSHPHQDPAERLSECELAAVPAAVRIARRFVRHLLVLWKLDELADDVELLVSELVTNAVQATMAFSARPGVRDDGTPMVIVRLRLARRSLYVEVSDVDANPPVLRKPGELAERGRGLRLVTVLSDDWGYLQARKGKIVWVRYDVADPEP